MARKKYGTVVRHGRTWYINAEAHVMIKLRRLFGRAVQQHGTMQINDSHEVCKDLGWILDRYPMAVDDADWIHILQGAKEHDQRTETFNNILSGYTAPKAFDLAIAPRDYQRIAADLALRVRGLLIADDLGLGKTCMGIAVLTDPRTRPALVVTMTHLTKQWEVEIKKFAPNLTTHIIKKKTPYDIVDEQKKSRKGQTDMFDPMFPDVVIINYHKLSGWRDVFAGVMRSALFDEIQELRHDGTEKYRSAEHVSHGASFSIGMSATPIFNYGLEFYHVLNILRPGEIGTRQEFIREWCGGTVDMSGRARISDPKAFGSYVREQGIMIRRRRKDVGRELPALTKTPHYVDSDPKTLAAVQSSVVNLAMMLLERSGTTFDRMRAGGELDMKMRQATGLAKAHYVAEFVKMIADTGEKVVLYGWHHAVYRVWQANLKKAGIGTVMFTGEESVTQKEEARRKFMEEDDTTVMIMSLRAGAGLDGLQTVCRTVVFGELDWSPGVHEQCIGRIYRDGQPDPVVAYFLVSEDGSDPVIADVLGLKKAQIEGVRDPDAEIVETAEAPEEGIKRLAMSVLRSQGIDIGSKKDS